THWSQSTVRGILRNPVYLGRTVWNKWSEGKFFAVVNLKPEPRPAGRRRRNAGAEWVATDGTHEPIVDVETFERCQATRARARRGGRSPAALGVPHGGAGARRPWRLGLDRWANQVGRGRKAVPLPPLLLQQLQHRREVAVPGQRHRRRRAGSGRAA